MSEPSKQSNPYLFVALLLVAGVVIAGQWFVLATIDGKLTEVALRVDVPTGSLATKIDAIREELREQDRRVSALAAKSH